MIITATANDNLQDIINRAVSHHCTILLESGKYYQKLLINNSNITIESASGKAADVEIIFDDHALKVHADGKEYNTFRTYTVAVCGDNVTFKNITITNSNTNPKEVGQCVALSVYGNNFSAENCVLKSTQDTLFCGPLPDDLIVRYIDFLPRELNYKNGELKQKFTNCTIEGSVDFIFGCGNALFEKCEIVSVNDGRDTSYICAPAHSLKQVAGMVFHKCKMISKDMQDSSVFLARPWRDFGLTTFIDCEFGKHISSLGFDKWNDTARDRTARFYLCECTKLEKTVDWSKEITAKEADKYLNFFK